MSAFSADLTVEEDIARVEVVGELDLGTAARFRAVVPRVLLLGVREVHLDLRQLSFADTSGTYEVYVAYSRWRGRGMEVEITGAAPSVRQIFELTGQAGCLPPD